MKLVLAIALALMATAASATPFAASTPQQVVARDPVKWHLFVTYFTSSGVTAPIQLGPFDTEKACTNAATLIASKVAIGATACLRNQ